MALHSINFACSLSAASERVDAVSIQPISNVHVSLPGDNGFRLRVLKSRREHSHEHRSEHDRQPCDDQAVNDCPADKPFGPVGSAFESAHHKAILPAELEIPWSRLYGRSRSCSLSSHFLRYCPVCMSQGYHCVAHQFETLQRYPFTCLYLNRMPLLWVRSSLPSQCAHSQYTVSLPAVPMPLWQHRPLRDQQTTPQQKSPAHLAQDPVPAFLLLIPNV
jgi:hypothetical protein